MYEKDKRSFFERLTGTINVKDGDQVPEDVEVELYGSSEEDTSVEPAPPSTDTYESQEESPEEPQMIHNQLVDEEETEPEEEVIGELGVDIFEDDEKIVIQAMIAGVRPDDIDISITKREVKIKGTRRILHPVPEENYYHKELYWGGFAREIKLPGEVDPERAEAIEEHGLLELRLPKVDKSNAVAQQIKVKAI